MICKARVGQKTVVASLVELVSRDNDSGTGSHASRKALIDLKYKSILKMTRKS